MISILTLDRVEKVHPDEAAANELSGEKVLINPTQNILTSGKLVVTLYNQNNGISRQIEIVTNSVTQLP